MTTPILLFSSDPVTTELVCGYLRDFDVVLTVQDQRADIRALLAANRPAAVIISSQFAGAGGGFVACSTLRRDPAAQKTPILFVWTDVDASRVGFHSKLPTRADSYLQIPFDKRQFVAALDTLCPLRERDDDDDDDERTMLLDLDLPFAQIPDMVELGRELLATRSSSPAPPAPASNPAAATRATVAAPAPIRETSKRPPIPATSSSGPVMAPSTANRERIARAASTARGDDTLHGATRVESRPLLMEGPRFETGEMPSVVVQSSTRTPLPSATSPFRGIGLDESAAEEHTDADSVDRLGQVLVENERLRARVAELEAIVDSARRLQAQLASILTPDHQKN